MTASGMLVSAIACFSFLFLGVHSHLFILIGQLILLGIGMGMFTPPNNSAIMGAAPKDKLGLAGGVLNMMRSLGLIFGVDISGVIFTTLEHKYLAENGYPNVQHIFQNGSIPVAMKDHAFMRGFIVVLGVLMVLNFVAAFLSTAKKERKTVDAAAAIAAKEFEGI
jgi:MFS family permease